MAVRRLPPTPRSWLQSLPGRVAMWFERVTITMPVTGRVDVTLNPASVAANATAEEAFTVNDAREGDWVGVTKPSHTAGLGIVNARVSATNTVSITFMNTTASAIDPPEETYRVWLIRWNEG